jgi:hypothetical protein
LDSRQGQKYGKTPAPGKEGDAHDDSYLSPVATSATTQVSQNWKPSRVRVDFLRKDPYNMLERVAAATGTNISLEHSYYTDSSIRVSADVLDKVENALQRLKKLDSLLVRLTLSSLDRDK